MMLSGNIRIARNDKGRAVFAARSILRDEIVESCPVLVVAPDFWALRGRKREPPFMQWAYLWPDTDEAVIALGAGSLYNHSYKPNANWRFWVDLAGDRYIEVFAIQGIERSREITINYLGSPAARGKLDFKVLP